MSTTFMSAVATPVQASKWVVTSMVLATLAACGGGSDGCTPFTDSFGKSVSCEDMRQLSGANLSAVEGGGDAGSGAGDAGADGTGADGAPIANMELVFEDITGKTVTTKTDANGYYRINLRGMKSPLVATVKREGKPWKSMLVQDIVRAPANRQFYTINLTGLTDVVASEVALKAGLTGAGALTPAKLNEQKAAVPNAIAKVNSLIASPLATAGLNTVTFDPLKTAFVPDKTGYDKVLESVTITRSANGSTSLVANIRSAVCMFTPFSGASQPGGSATSITVASDGGHCAIAVMVDSARTIPASNGQIKTSPTHGSVVFSDNYMYYTPVKGYVGNDSFVYTMEGKLANGTPVTLTVNVSVTVQAAPGTPAAPSTPTSTPSTPTAPSTPSTPATPPATAQPPASSAYTGNFAGTYVGNQGDKGTFSLQVSTTGSISGTAGSTVYGNSTTLSGSVNLSTGSIQFGVASGNATFTGTISTQGAMSGTWRALDGETGTFSGTRQ